MVLGGNPGAGVVAGEHAPQPSLVQQGEGQRGAHPHVAQIDQVHGRWLTQQALALVEGGGHSLQTGTHRYGRGIHVGDHPQQIARVQLAGLCRDVRGGEMLAQEPLRHTRGCGFGQDLATPVRREAIQHHAVVLQELLQGDDAGLHEGVQRMGVFQGAGRLGQLAQQSHVFPFGTGRVTVWDQLQHDPGRRGAGHPVDHHLQQEAGQALQLAHHRACLARRPLAPCGPGLLGLAQGLQDVETQNAPGRQGQPVFQPLGVTHHPAGLRLADQHGAVALDRLGNVNGLLRAVRQVLRAHAGLRLCVRHGVFKHGLHGRLPCGASWAISLAQGRWPWRGQGAGTWNRDGR